LGARHQALVQKWGAEQSERGLRRCARCSACSDEPRRPEKSQAATSLNRLSLRVGLAVGASLRFRRARSPLTHTPGPHAASVGTEASAASRCPLQRPPTVLARPDPLCIVFPLERLELQGSRFMARGPRLGNARGVDEGPYPSWEVNLRLDSSSVPLEPLCLGKKQFDANTRLGHSCYGTERYASDSYGDDLTSRQPAQSRACCDLRATHVRSPPSRGPRPLECMGPARASRQVEQTGEGCRVNGEPLRIRGWRGLPPGS
jgi:hypothetical protein